MDVAIHLFGVEIRVNPEEMDMNLPKKLTRSIVYRICNYYSQIVDKQHKSNKKASHTEYVCELMSDYALNQWTRNTTLQETRATFNKRQVSK